MNWSGDSESLISLIASALAAERASLSPDVEDVIEAHAHPAIVKDLRKWKAGTTESMDKEK
jgi:hypothetical protein